MESKEVKNECCGGGTCNTEDNGRRAFLKSSGLTALMLMAGKYNIMAGPFSENDFDHIVPSDKKLSKEWIASLYERGKPLTASGGELKYIGMPINGITTGQVYLGGDGRLWRWNLIGKRNVKTENPKGYTFMKPLPSSSPMSQGFALKVNDNYFSLDDQGFEKVVFTNKYPMATVDYEDKSCPVKVQLKAYTPFIPLNRDDSSYPVILMEYHILNDSKEDQEITIAGWIQNISNRTSNRQKIGKKKCSYQQLEEISTVECSATFGNKSLEKATDFGAVALGLMGDAKGCFANIDLNTAELQAVFAHQDKEVKHLSVSETSFEQDTYASLGKTIKLKAGASQKLTFTLSWRFPNGNYDIAFGRSGKVVAPNHYATLFDSATKAAHKVAEKKEVLHGYTQKWVDTWYNSTLPYWFLERTFLTIDCIQTEMGQRLAETKKTPEFYNFYEGVRCCPGNCNHVWHYAHGLSRIFPEIERECRDKVEYGLGFDENNGDMRHRYVDAKFENAIDGTCGTILRVYRESQMTTDYSFLKSVWSRTKLSMDYVIEKWDADEDGMLEGAQHNTLDEPWYGQVHWLTNLYHASLKVAALMAEKMNEPKTAAKYTSILNKGVPKMLDTLWNDDFGYFIHIPGPGEMEKHGSTNGCHIDQVLGDSWLWNVGVERMLPKEKIVQSLQALWKYNFSPNIGSFRKQMKEGRWYAAEGNAGLIMCTFPHGKIEPKSGKKSYAGYLNECMTGFEWQVAAHMIWEGMVEEGLAIGKAIYDRYLPKDRNPYNEIECSDHYSRAMASYGAYMAICGYQYDGPEGILSFAPRIQEKDFRVAFTTAEGWGSFSQKLDHKNQVVTIKLEYGKLSLKSFRCKAIKDTDAKKVKISIDDINSTGITTIKSTLEKIKDTYYIYFKEELNLKEGEILQINFK